MRGFVAILLLAVFGLPLLSPSLAAGGGADAGLPACCRRLGEHHCAMSLGERLQAGGTPGAKAWKAPAEKCPYCPASVAAAHADPVALPARYRPLTHMVCVTGRVRAAECTWRVARERSRHKRGPPPLALLT